MLNSKNTSFDLGEFFAVEKSKSSSVSGASLQNGIPVMIHDLVGDFYILREQNSFTVFSKTSNLKATVTCFGCSSDDAVIKIDLTSQVLIIEYSDSYYGRPWEPSDEDTKMVDNSEVRGVPNVDGVASYRQTKPFGPLN